MSDRASRPTLSTVTHDFLALLLGVRRGVTVALHGLEGRPRSARRAARSASSIARPGAGGQRLLRHPGSRICALDRRGERTQPRPDPGVHIDHPENFIDPLEGAMQRELTPVVRGEAASSVAASSPFLSFQSSAPSSPWPPSGPSSVLLA